MTGPYYAPPPGQGFNRRVGVVLEIAPNVFMRYILEAGLGDVIKVDVDHSEPEVDVFQALGPIRTPPRAHARFVISGWLISEEEAERPVWADAHAGEPVAEIQAPPRQLSGPEGEGWTPS